MWFYPESRKRPKTADFTMHRCFSQGPKNL